MTKSLIPVIDLTTLLTMAFLHLGNLVGSIHSQERLPAPQAVASAPIVTVAPEPPRDAAQAETPGAEDGASAPPARPNPEDKDARAKLAEAIARAKQAIALLMADIAGVSSRLDALRQEVAARAGREEEFRRLVADLAGRTAELERLEQEKRQHLQRLAELQAALASAEEKPGTPTGAPLVRQDRKPTEVYAVLLAAGRVFPLRREYFVGERRDDGSVVVWPREGQQGLTVEETRRPGSEVLREITRPKFREGGRVVMLVNPDSFDTFRALRDAVARERVDWGWEPYEGRRIIFSDKGSDIPSQRGEER